MMIKIKGSEIEEPRIVDSFDRRALQIKNSIMETLKLIGADRYNVKILPEKDSAKRAGASVSWYFDGRGLKYSYSRMTKVVENLYIIDKVLKIEVKKLLSKEINPDEFSREFSEDDDLSEQLTDARKTLGVDASENDFEVISNKYKDLAKKHHPDMPEGNHELFQKINAAHKLIKKELM
jgi:hypothetical protein